MDCAWCNLIFVYLCSCKQRLDYNWWPFWFIWANPFSQKGKIMDMSSYWENYHGHYHLAVFFVYISNGHSVSHQYQSYSYGIPSGVIMNDLSEFRARLDELEKETALAFLAAVSVDHQITEIEKRRMVQSVMPVCFFFTIFLFIIYYVCRLATYLWT